MHGEREGRSSSTLSQSMLTHKTNTTTSISIESACIPIGCSVSAKYRGAFCSAQVKTVDRQVKLKVTLIETNDILTISEEQLVRPMPLLIGRTVLIRVPSTHRHESNSRSGLSAMIQSSEEKQAIIKKVYDNSIYTVVFNDGDEKSLRRSSLCLQGIRLYQTQIGQEKLLEDLPASSTLPRDDSDEQTSIVAIRRHGTHHQTIFPALILQRKSLADYIWVKSFVDGREYIVHKRDDVQSYKNNSEVQSLCRSTSKQATKACEKFVQYRQIPKIWQKNKKTPHDAEDKEIDSNISASDVDDSDEETTGEKDSFVAQLFAFMDDRGTSINNIPKIHNYDLDLHRLFKIVRTFGGFNKVTKNDQWSKVYMKMGLPDDLTLKNGRLIEHAYKKYLFAYEDLSKKLGTMNAPNAYLGGRTSVGNDSRRHLVRVRQQSGSKQASPSTRPKQSVKNPTPTSPRKTITIKKVDSLSTSESETSDDERRPSKNQKPPIHRKKLKLTIKKKIPETKSVSSSSSTDSQQIHERSSSMSTKKTRFNLVTESDMKPVIKIPKISYEILKESAPAIHKLPRRQLSIKLTKIQDNTSIDQSNKLTFSQEQTTIHDLTPLSVTPVSPSPPPSIINESSTTCFIDTRPITEDTSEMKVLASPSVHEIDNFPSNKRSYPTINEHLPPSKRSKPSSEHSKTIIKQSLVDIMDEERTFLNGNEQDNNLGIWKSLESIASNEDDVLPPTIPTTLLNNGPYYTSTIHIEQTRSTVNDFFQIKEEMLVESTTSSTSIETILPPSDNRRASSSSSSSTRQQKRRTFREPKDFSTFPRKRTRLDLSSTNDNQSNSDQIPSPIEQQQQQTIEIKRYRTVAKRSGKRTVNQQDNENEDCHLNSLMNGTVRQQLEDMFQHRTSRYNFLDLNNNLTGETRLGHLKDRMQQCQKAFFNLKSALNKIEKQRKLFLRRQKPLISQSTTPEPVFPSPCT